MVITDRISTMFSRRMTCSRHRIDAVVRERRARGGELLDIDAGRARLGVRINRLEAFGVDAVAFPQQRRERPIALVGCCLRPVHFSDQVLSRRSPPRDAEGLVGRPNWTASDAVWQGSGRVSTAWRPNQGPQRFALNSYVPDCRRYTAVPPLCPRNLPPLASTVGVELVGRYNRAVVLAGTVVR